MSSLGRPLDPSWPTNRAVLVLMPAGALIAAVSATWVPGLAGTSRLWAVALGAGTMLGGWAVGRELAPDDQRAAFVALVLGFGTLLFVPGVSLVLLFATLMLTRMVNHTVGLPATTLDSVVVLGLSGWAVADTGSPAVGVVTAFAFGLDAWLPDGRRRQWGFAALCLVMVAALAGAAAEQDRVVSSPIVLGVPATSILVGAAVVAALVLHGSLTTGALRSTCDATGDPLSIARVRWGVIVALLVGTQGLFLGEGGASSVALVWASLAGVGLSGIVPPGASPSGNAPPGMEPDGA
ncbi:MAG: hypothetical protein WEA34_09285 [Gemmatimonadota bacterium]